MKLAIVLVAAAACLIAAETDVVAEVEAINFAMKAEDPVKDKAEKSVEVTKPAEKDQIDGYAKPNLPIVRKPSNEKPESPPPSATKDEPSPDKDKKKAKKEISKKADSNKKNDKKPKSKSVDDVDEQSQQDDDDEQPKVNYKAPKRRLRMQSSASNDMEISSSLLLLGTFLLMTL